MKIALIRFSSALAAIVALSAFGAAQTAGKEDVVNTILKTEKFDTFASLLTDAGLTFELKEKGPITVFAPTDEAFAKMPASRLEALRWNRDSLRKLLLGHVVAGQYTAQEAVKKGWLKTLAGTYIKTRVEAGRGRIGGAGFSIPNVYVSNGILHGVDAVIDTRPTLPEWRETP